MVEVPELVARLADALHATTFLPPLDSASAASTGAARWFGFGGSAPEAEEEMAAAAAVARSVPLGRSLMLPLENARPRFAHHGGAPADALLRVASRASSGGGEGGEDDRPRRRQRRTTRVRDTEAAGPLRSRRS